jgi:hypothetical protein
MSQRLNRTIAVIGIDLMGHDKRGAMVQRQKWSRG